jgi:hypothetical protein
MLKKQKNSTNKKTVYHEKMSDGSDGITPSNPLFLISIARKPFGIDGNVLTWSEMKKLNLNSNQKSLVGFFFTQ